jgi:DNA-binding MarR family transcriptional regulator
MHLDLERLAALNLWRGVVVSHVQADEPDLSARQMAILFTVYLSEGPHTVRGLAASLQVGKPAVVRALDTLEALGLLRRRKDPADLRSVLIEPTRAGQIYLDGFADLITMRARGAEPPLAA